MPNLNNLTIQDLQWGTANWSGQGYIDGLKMVWNSATSISVTSGAAFIPSLSKCLPSTTTLTLSGLVLAASTWYHLYLYLNAGAPAVECVPTAPAAPYYGAARTKTGDTSRRYIGSVVTDSSGNILEFTHFNGNRIIYAGGNSGASPFRVLSAGNSTTNTAVSLTGIVPVTSDIPYLSLSTNSTTGYFQVRKTTSSSIFFTQPVSATSLATPSTIFNMPSLNQAIAYNCQSSSSSAYIDVLGYTYER